MDPLKQIVGAERLTAIFGDWPAFHDAEVVWMRLGREGTDLEPGPILDVMIHAFEMTREIDAAGYYVLRNHVLVHLRFAGIDNLKLDDFNQQNALFGLTISREDGTASNFKVVFDPSWGVGAELSCKTVTVVSVQPSDKQGRCLPP